MNEETIRTGTRVLELERVREEASRCGACPLGKIATTTVVYRGSVVPIVLFIGQSPGAEEDLAGEPFVGKSGKMLNEKIAEAPFPEYGITNAILHRPIEKFDPAHAVACAPFLRRIVATVSPKLLVPIGNDAQRAVLDLMTPIPRFGIVHPSSVLHGGPRARWNNDWTRLRQWIASKGPL